MSQVTYLCHFTRDSLDKMVARTAVRGAKQWYITVKSNEPLYDPKDYSESVCPTRS